MVSICFNAASTSGPFPSAVLIKTYALLMATCLDWWVIVSLDIF